MKTSSAKKVKVRSKIEAGSVLFAQPFWKENIYQHSVILVIEHNSRGTTGIIINKHSTMMVADALPSLKITERLFFGGASDGKTISFLHSNDDVSDSVFLGNDLYWGGNFETIEELVNTRRLKPEQINFYSGFVLWNKGQLMEEINSSKWWVCKMNAQQLLSTKPGKLWSQGLENCGHIYFLFDDTPDPSAN